MLRSGLAMPQTSLLLMAPGAWKGFLADLEEIIAAQSLHDQRPGASLEGGRDSGTWVGRD